MSADVSTSTVDGAAAFERAHGAEYDDGPSASDLADLARADRQAAERDRTDPWCTETRTTTDDGGTWVQGCALRQSEHARNGGHKPDPWTRRRLVDHATRQTPHDHSTQTGDAP